MLMTHGRELRRARRVAMALSKLSGDEQRIVFSQLCNVLDPRLAVAFSSASSELRELTQAERQQLKACYDMATSLCRKLGRRRCKQLREAKTLDCDGRGLTADDLALLGSLGPVLPALEVLEFYERTAGPDGVQRLAEKLGAGALPAVSGLSLQSMCVGDAGASAFAAALGRGAMPRLISLDLTNTDIGDAGLVALAPALRRLPALENLFLWGNPLGDEGLAALVAPPLPAGAPPTTTGGLAKLKKVELGFTQITDAGCATLVSALDSGMLPALKMLQVGGTPGACTSASRTAVTEALERATSRAARPSRRSERFKVGATPS